jgi:hypothetical protein
MAQPACNPGLAPSDFFLFGFRKRQIQEVPFPDRETLKGTISRFFGEVDREVLTSVLLDWIEPFEWVIENDGEYYNSQIKNESKMFASEREIAIM